MRFSLYAGCSSVAALGIVLYAYATRLQFYPTVVYLVTSKPSIMVLGNFALVLTLLFGRLFKLTFLGRLRDAEVDIVWDNVRYTVTETCLALTVFREEMSMHVVFYFTALLFCKVFHWLSDARVEHVEQAQETSRLSHLRVVSLMVVLFMTDLAFSATAIYNVQRTGPSVELLFGFEFIVLSLNISTTFVRYCLSVADLHFVSGRWYNKSLYELYLKLLTDSLQLLVYMVFFALIFTYYGMPLHLVRQLYMSVRNVYDRMRHFLRFRRVTNNLNERFPTATEEELASTDRVCIICREEMELSANGGGDGAPKKLPCGHIFHFFCLRNWLERQLSCPTCRAAIPSDASATAVGAAAARLRAQAERAAADARQQQEQRQPQPQQQRQPQPQQQQQQQHQDQPQTQPPQPPRIDVAQQIRDAREHAQRHAQAHNDAVSAESAAIAPQDSPSEPAAVSSSTTTTSSSSSTSTSSSSTSTTAANNASLAGTVPTINSAGQQRPQQHQQQQPWMQGFGAAPFPFGVAPLQPQLSSAQPPLQLPHLWVPPFGAPPEAASSGAATAPHSESTQAHGHPWFEQNLFGTFGPASSGPGPMFAPTVTQDLERRIEFLQMQLHLYRAQMNLMHKYQQCASQSATTTDASSGHPGSKHETTTHSQQKSGNSDVGAKEKQQEKDQGDQQQRDARDHQVEEEGGDIKNDMHRGEEEVKQLERFIFDASAPDSDGSEGAPDAEGLRRRRTAAAMAAAAAESRNQHDDE